MYKLDKSLVEKIGFNPYYPNIHSSLDAFIKIENKDFINLASNNYLGLANDERIKKSAINSIEKYGVSMCGTPIATGYIDLYEKVEKKLAKFVGVEDAIILPSCYQVNNGIFSILVKKEDLIIVDHFAHSSLLEGIKSVGCKMKPFLHNNMDHLEKILKKSVDYSKKIVVTESVFSTEGSIASIEEMMKLCEKYDAILVVDDSHGIGVIGESGRGVLEEFNIRNFKGIYIASLGKAMANMGGMIGSNKETIEYLRYYLPHLIYSTALVPSVLGGIEGAINVIEEEYPVLKEKMNHYKNLIQKSLKDIGLEVLNTKTPINAINSKSSENTLVLAKKFYDENILTIPFIFPSVPENNGKLRLIAGANLREESIYDVIEKIKRLDVT